MPDQDESDVAVPALLPVEPAYRNVLRLRFAILWVPLIIGAVILDRALEGTLLHRLPSVGVPLLALLCLATVPQRVYARIGYSLTNRWLRVVRGWMFHTDTIVPLVRVQHIDVRRGPAEKLFGVATLVVHTAGTHNSIVTVPGLSPDRAAEIRDVIREHVRTDFE